MQYISPLLLKFTKADVYMEIELQWVILTMQINRNTNPDYQQKIRDQGHPQHSKGYTHGPLIVKPKGCCYRENAT